MRSMSVLREATDDAHADPSQRVRARLPTFAWALLRRHPRVRMACALGLLALAAGVSVAVAEGDTGEDLGDAINSTARAAFHLRWQFGAIVVGLAIAHYFAAA